MKEKNRRLSKMISEGLPRSSSEGGEGVWNIGDIDTREYDDLRFWFGPTGESESEDDTNSEQKPQDIQADQAPDASSAIAKTECAVWGLSEPMREFFIRNNYKTAEYGNAVILPKGLNRRMMEPEEASAIAREYTWRSAKPGRIYVGNVVGSQANHHDLHPTLASFMSYLYRECGNGIDYGSRCVKHLNGDYKEKVEEILKNIEPVEISSDGKHHLLCGDGNHRLFFLMTALEMELAECGEDKKKRDALIEKYTIPAYICEAKFPKDIDERLATPDSSRPYTGWRPSDFI